MRANIWETVDPDTLTPRERVIGKASNLRIYAERYETAKIDFRKHCEQYRISDEEIDQFDARFRQ